MTESCYLFPVSYDVFVLFFCHSTLLLTWLTFLGLLTQVLTSYDHILHSYFTLKGQFQNLTSGQVRSRSGQRQVTTGVGQYAYLPRRLDEPSRLAPFARLYLHLSWFIGKNRTSTSFDLRWPPCDPQSSVAYWSSQMGWVSMILKELGGFGWFMWNGKNFHISS